MSKLKNKLKNKTKSHVANKDSGGGFKKWFSVPDGVEMYSVQEGKKKNLIDIMPYIVQTKNNPETVKGDPDYLLALWVHRGIGVKKEDIVCLKQYGKPCPICEEVERLKDDDADGNKKLIDDIKGKRRALYNVIDLKDGNKHKLFETSHYKFERKLLVEAEDSEDGTIIFADLEEGFSVRIKGIADTFNGNEFISLDSVDLEEREEQYEEDIINEMISLDTLVEVLSYDQIEKIFFQAPDEDDEREEDSPEEEEPKRKSKKSIQKSGKKSKSMDEDDDEPASEDEEDEEVEKKSKHSSKKKSNKSKCPSGHSFGEDCDEYADCDDCDLWDECSDE